MNKKSLIIVVIAVAVLGYLYLAGSKKSALNFSANAPSQEQSNPANTALAAKLTAMLGGKVKMLVNGRENNEFENYPMQDKDKIEIRYE